MRRLRLMTGAILFDAPAWFRILLSMAGSRDAWLAVCNRHERLIPSPVAPKGYRCDWKWTSELHISNVFPGTGSALTRVALDRWPISFGSSPHVGSVPEVSFVIGHRGMERLPILLLTLASIAAQTMAVECIVVEQSEWPEIETHMPPWVRYIHVRSPGNSPYSRSWGLNVGARAATGRVLVLHDNDMLVPERYTEQIGIIASQGHEVIDLKRFIFYLSDAATQRLRPDKLLTLDSPPESVTQNARGGSLAVTRSGYIELGGYDESFVGWGGEDNEFWGRALTRRVWDFGCLPLLHLWHAPQKEKSLGHLNPAGDQLQALEAIAPEERIRRLSATKWGSLDGPNLR